MAYSFSKAYFDDRQVVFQTDRIGILEQLLLDGCRPDTGFRIPNKLSMIAPLARDYSPGDATGQNPVGKIIFRGFVVSESPQVLRSTPPASP